ncbi:MAG: hypothetical protein ACD_22C00136G0010 [uncultured bacterium]|nr:MAG: hypothetical protein ACD_22C00136G0010 [uncultured bacterium]
MRFHGMDDKFLSIRERFNLKNSFSVIMKIHKTIFIISHSLVDIRFYFNYRKLIELEKISYEQKVFNQVYKLRRLLSYVHSQVPYYSEILNRLKLKPTDFSSISDLEKLPILTKNIIKENYDKFTPRNLSNIKYYNFSTGGSTGTPLKFRISHNDRLLSGLLTYRGWGKGGYELGNRMVFLAGSSLVKNSRNTLEKTINELSRNVKKLSAFDMGTEQMKNYLTVINSFKPRHIRGYASALFFFAKWIEETKQHVWSPASIFTTAEVLHPEMRKTIEKSFNTRVFDGYGLNDGGLSAFESVERPQLLVDTERSVMEVLDRNNCIVSNGTGRILATSLSNYAFPFIRYDTGDIGTIHTNSMGMCLEKIVGRQQEFLITPEGNNVHGEFITHILWEISGIKRFQLVQEDMETLHFYFVVDSTFDVGQLSKIDALIKGKSAFWKTKYSYVDTIKEESNSKYKFVINNLWKKR